MNIDQATLALEVLKRIQHGEIKVDQGLAILWLGGVSPDLAERILGVAK